MMSDQNRLKQWPITGLLGLFFCLIFQTSNLWAQSDATSLDAYSIEVAVAERSVEEQQNAFLVGMRYVLLQNSGDKTLLNRDDVRAGLKKAEQYVESFSYRTPPAGTVISKKLPVTDRVRDSGAARQLMLVKFDPVLIDELISSRGKSSAAEDKAEATPFSDVSSALMWLIIDDAGKSMLVGGSTGQNVMERAREIAGGAGMGMLFPAADSVDYEALTVDDILSANPERLSTAVGRYASPILLAAHLARNNLGTWVGQWLKFDGQAVATEQIESPNLDNALQQGIRWLNPEAAQSGIMGDTVQAMPATTSLTEALVWVSPLRTTASYAEVIRFLSGNAAVQLVYPKEILDSGMVFAVSPRSAVSQIAAASGSQNWIRQTALPVSANDSQFAGNIVLSLEYSR